MDEEPVLHDYRIEDRAEVLYFIGEVFPSEIADREIAQWSWKYEANPFIAPDRPAVNFIRVGGRMVGLSAGFRVPMWMAAIECFAEGRGAWIIHPQYRIESMLSGNELVAPMLR